MTSQPAKDLFARRLEALSREGAAPDSETRLAEIFARSEAACRDQDARLAKATARQMASDAPAS